MSVYDSIDPAVYDKLKAEHYRSAQIAEIMQIPLGRLNQWISMRKRGGSTRNCSRCIYRMPSYLDGRCNYLGLTGHSRPCPADACTVFEPGARKKEPDEIYVE